MGGGTCSGPGGSCNCPTGQTFCTTSNSCIPTTSCCPATGCSVTGETCSGPGGTCSCPTGQDVCGNICIGSTTCCTNSDCLPPPTNVATTTCPGPGDACKILTCNSGCYDTNGQYADGCECCEDANLSCGGTNLGTLGLGNVATGQGHLPGSEADWFTVSFSTDTDISFHPSVTLTAAAGIVFDIYTSCSGGGSSPDICKNEGGNSVGLTSWDVTYTCQTQSPSCTTVNNNNFQAITFVGTIFIKVYRSSGTPTTCAETAFTVNVSND